MAIEKALAVAVEKPWGCADLRPWSDERHEGAAIGELWFQRQHATAKPPALLLKLIFASEPLSIQVHPDDKLAGALGEPNGKTEAWYVLSAAPGAKVALGLRYRITAAQLRSSIEDGSIADIVQWREVKDDAVVFVPAGTIHAIGAGLIIAEIQQRSDTTFRLFDFNRNRGIDVDSALAAAIAGPADAPLPSAPNARALVQTRLIACPHFELELIELRAMGECTLDAGIETWILVLEGSASIGRAEARMGEAIFLENEFATIAAGPAGLRGLCARAGRKSGFDSRETPDRGLPTFVHGPANSMLSARPLPAMPQIHSMETKA